MLAELAQLRDVHTTQIAAWKAQLLEGAVGVFSNGSPAPSSDAHADLAIMRRIDELHLDYPFARSRMLRDLLRGECIAIGRERVTTMMRRIAIEAIYRRPHTSKPADGHMAFPYLLRGMKSNDRTRCGRWISRIFRWLEALSTSWRWWALPN